MSGPIGTNYPGNRMSRGPDVGVYGGDEQGPRRFRQSGIPNNFINHPDAPSSSQKSKGGSRRSKASKASKASKRASVLPSATKAGQLRYLHKNSDGQPEWSRAKMELRGKYLSYKYVSQPSMKLKGIKLSPGDCAVADQRKVDKFQFKVQTKAIGNCYLRAASLDDMNAWIDAVNATINKLKGRGGGSKRKGPRPVSALPAGDPDEKPRPISAMPAGDPNGGSSRPVSAMPAGDPDEKPRPISAMPAGDPNGSRPVSAMPVGDPESGSSARPVSAYGDVDPEAGEEDVEGVFDEDDYADFDDVGFEDEMRSQNSTATNLSEYGSGDDYGASDYVGPSDDPYSRATVASPDMENPEGDDEDYEEDYADDEEL